VGLQKSLVVDPWPQSCRVSGLLFLPPLPFRPPLALTSFAGHLLQFRSQTPEGLDNFFPLLRVAPGTTHGGQLPAVFQPIDQVNARFEVSEVIPQVLDHAVRGSSLLTLLQVFRVKILQAPNATSTQNSVSSGPALPLNESLGLNFSKLSSNDSTFAGSSFSAPASFPARSSVMGITAAAVEVGTFRTDADIPFRITLITGIALLLWRVLQNHPDSGRVISDDPVWEAHGVPGALLSPAEIQQHLRALSRNLPESHHPRAGLHAARSPLLPNEHDHFLISRLHIPDSKS